jgi:DNA (cytosine-5)-methyltransferase 1
MICKWQVEIDPFCRKVLTKYWPDVPKYGDIRELRGDELEPVDLICGGFPCQDISEANTNGKGLQGSRSGLWFEYERLIREIRPSWAVVENVSRLLSINDGRDFGTILRNLAELGYDAQWSLLSSCAVGAPHSRERMFLVAHTNSQRLQTSGEKRIRDDEETSSGWASTKHIYSSTLSIGSSRRQIRTAEPGIPRVDDGVPDRIHRNRAVGNAVDPDVAELIGRMILEVESNGI